jgi:hypothetical protein
MEQKYVFYFFRGRCYGICPTYTIQILANGKLFLDGSWKRSEKWQDVHLTSFITKEQFNALEKIFSKMNFKEKYSEKNCYEQTDAPTVVMKMKLDKKFIYTQHYLGCRSAPKVLIQLEDQVDKILETDKLVEPYLSK